MRNQNDKNKRVLTPGGWRPKSKVREVGPGQHISGAGGRLRIIETTTGKVIEDLGEIPGAGSAGPKKRRAPPTARSSAKKQPRKK